jgi:hypothetical protein
VERYLHSRVLLNSRVLGDNFAITLFQLNSAEAKNAWSFTSIRGYFFMAHSKGMGTALPLPYFSYIRQLPIAVRLYCM